LVVGGAGYIGGAVTDALIKKGIKFTVYDNLLYEPHYHKPVDFILGDVREVKKIKKILPEYSHVIWLAAIVGEGASKIVPDLTRRINQESVQWLAKNYNGRIIFTSTCSVYGNQNIALEGESINENRKPDPLSLYAETKVAAEKYLENKNALVLRLGTLFGIGDHYSRPRLDLAGNQMPVAAHTNGELAVYGGGVQWRPFIHVKDVGDIIASAIGKKTKGVYNIGAINLRISDLANMVSKITHCKIKHIGEVPSDKRNYNINTAKAKSAGLLPTKWRTLEEGLNEVLHLVKTGKLKNPNDDLYINEKYLTRHCDPAPAYRQAGAGRQGRGKAIS